jgi:hypothetical protein
MSTGRGTRSLGIREGGWVILLAVMLAAGLIAWALLGVMRGRHPQGDGQRVESYGFDLTDLRTGGGALVASGNPRDFLQALDDPATMPGHEMQRWNETHRTKFVVSGDRVIGMVVNGKARAYPLSVMQVHEVVNDTLGGVPIAVTFSPLCDAAMAFDRRVGGQTTRFGVSGLLLDNNLVLYDRSPVPSLWSQMGAEAIAGPAASRATRLEALPGVQTCTWRHWLTAHPDTDVIMPAADDQRRMKAISYSRYLLSPRLEFPAARWREDGVAAKTPVIVLQRGEARREIPLAEAARGLEPFELGGCVVETDAQAEPASVLFHTRDGSPLFTLPCLHFAWASFNPSP